MTKECAGLSGRWSHKFPKRGTELTQHMCEDHFHSLDDQHGHYRHPPTYDLPFQIVSKRTKIQGWPGGHQLITSKYFVQQQRPVTTRVFPNLHEMTAVRNLSLLMAASFQMQGILAGCPCNVCPEYPSCRRSERSLIAVSSFSESANFEREMAACGDLSYNLAVRLRDQHFGLTAIPPERPVIPDEEMFLECPTLYLHNDLLGKVDLRVDNLEDHLNKFEGIDTYELGSFTLTSIMNAFDKALDTTASTSLTAGEGEYDIMDNNCVTFVISMMQQLDIAITPEQVTFVVNAFLRQELMGGSISVLRNHPAFSLLFPSGQGIDDRLFMMEYAMYYVETQMNGNNGTSDSSSVIGCAMEKSSVSGAATSVFRNVGALLLGWAVALLMA